MKLIEACIRESGPRAKQISIQEYHTYV